MYRFYEDDPVYKLDERTFTTWAEVCVTARLISHLTGHNTVVYKANETGSVDYNETPLAIFFNGKMFTPALNEFDTENEAPAAAAHAASRR